MANSWGSIELSRWYLDACELSFCSRCLVVIQTILNHECLDIDSTWSYLTQVLGKEGKIIHLDYLWRVSYLYGEARALYLVFRDIQLDFSLYLLNTKFWEPWPNFYYCGHDCSYNLKASQAQLSPEKRANRALQSFRVWPQMKLAGRITQIQIQTNLPTEIVSRKWLYNLSCASSLVELSSIHRFCSTSTDYSGTKT